MPHLTLPRHHQASQVAGSSSWSQQPFLLIIAISAIFGYLHYAQAGKPHEATDSMLQDSAAAVDTTAAPGPPGPPGPPGEAGVAGPPGKALQINEKWQRIIACEYILFSVMVQLYSHCMPLYYYNVYLCRSPGGGVSYTRWGRTTCPTTEGTQLVYEGATVGSAYSHAGSAEYLCLHNTPEFLKSTPGRQEQRTRLYITEYEALDSPPAFSSIFRYDAPCSVCYTPSRSTKITIPGRITCPDSWTREYYG